ncbi:MAG: 2,3-bisphosphoglycerate-independent phosphoglycerate mutase, partial [Neisseriaceae bacterium]
METLPTKKVLLIILDGFGIRDESEFNAITHARTPNLDYYIQKYSFGAIDASGLKVGLPQNQFGNSEVGHLNIGAGRIVQQDITRIDEAIQNNTFESNPVLVEALKTTQSRCLHIMGLLSDGGVHCHINHIFALIKLAEKSDYIDKVWLHVFYDGRDTPPQSATNYLIQLNHLLSSCNKIKIATSCGRYYAMDRDKRYDRIQVAYNAIIYGVQEKSNLCGIDPIQSLQDSYSKNENDEFVKPHIFNDYHGVQDGDSIIYANFRSDRAIELTDAILSDSFTFFPCKKVDLSNFITMTRYDNKFNAKVAFAPSTINNTLGEYISNLGLHQLRVAETEKYPHVTYFFNGGRKEPYPNEERILISSPRDVNTYDQKPEMSLPEVTEKLVKAIKENKYDFIITNFANGDMVGHSGNFEATIKAVEAIDTALGKCITAMLNIGGEVLVIADHGNCEEMFDYKVNQPHTQHTT